MSEKKDRGWDYLNSDNDDFDHDPDGDGSWGYQNDDGSGSFYGADGSWGYENSDGSASYYGNDGSWGYRNSDGSITYYGNDGSWGYRNSDGSGTFYGEDGDSHSFDSSDNDDSDSSSLSPSEELIAGLFGLGLAAYAIHKNNKDQERREEQKRQEEERRQREIIEAARKRKAKADRAKRFAFYRKHWKVIFVLFIVLAGSSFGFFKYTEYQKLIEVSVSSEDLIGLDHGSVEKSLYDAGFTNIHDSVLRDLKIDEIKKEGIVTEVRISGDKDFTSISRHPYDAPVYITYHVVKEIAVPMSAKAAKKLTYTDLEKQFKEAGFVNISLVAECDLITGWLTKDGSIESISVNGQTEFDEYATYRPDDPVVITYHTFSKDKDD